MRISFLTVLLFVFAVAVMGHRSFLFQPFPYMTKKNQEKKIKYFRNEKTFQADIKSIFHQF